MNYNTLSKSKSLIMNASYWHLFSFLERKVSHEAWVNVSVYIRHDVMVQELATSPTLEAIGNLIDELYITDRH